MAKGKFILFVDTKKLSVGINCFPTNEESLELNGSQVFEYDVIERRYLTIFLDYSTIAQIKGIMGRYIKIHGKDRLDMPGCKEKMSFNSSLPNPIGK